MKRRRSLALTPLAFALALPPLAAQTAAPVRARGGEHAYAVEYGMNPSFHTWSSRAIVLADAMTRAREFVRFAQGPVGPATLIPLGQTPPLLGEGWPDPAALPPGERYGAALFVAMEGTLPDGTVAPYVVAWSGEGSCELEGTAVVGEANRTANRVEVFVDPQAGNPNAFLACLWDAPNPADPVRDVRVYLPGMEGSGALLWPPYLEKVAGMSGGHGPLGWRTLDWSRVNDYGRPLAQDGFVFDLAGVVTPASASQGTRRGMCPEFQVAFCNALDTDLHFNVPHRTDDLSVAEYTSFVVDALERIRDGSPGVPGVAGGQPFAGLAAGRTVTVELSNEIWNPGFPVNAWMQAQAQLAGVTPHEQIASEIALVFGLARQVFAGPDADRLRTFVGGRMSDAGYLQAVLDALPPGTHVDAAGPAAYFGPRPDVVAGWLDGASPGSCPNCPTPDEVLAAARAAIPDVSASLAANRQVVDAYTNPDASSPAFELYEAGANFQAGFQPWAGAAHEAQQLPAMHDAYVDDLVPALIANGVERVHWYSFMTDFDPNGIASYGLWNDMEQTIVLPEVDAYVHEGAPKAAAIYRGPPVTAGTPPASATFRTAGTNVASLDVERPVLGTTVTVAVDLTTTGHAQALILKSGQPSTTLLADGQALLVRPRGTFAFFGPVAGPAATLDFPLPNDLNLCGRALFVQALHFGGAPGFALSNARDLVAGGP